MSRLFIGPREQQFIADITKEFVKDVVGQYVIYYPVSVLYTKVHSVYDEAIEKVFENPIKVDVLAGQPTRAQNFGKFGVDGELSIELFIQSRDLIDKGLEVFAGDFFVYGHEVYEILQAIDLDNIYGQAEYDKATKVTAKLARTGEFDLDTFKELLETSKKFSDSTVEKKFIQQRGLDETEQGATNDTRQIRKRLKDDMADISLGEGPRKVDVDETENVAIDPEGSGFYHE